MTSKDQFVKDVLIATLSTWHANGVPNEASGEHVGKFIAKVVEATLAAYDTIK